MIIPIYSKRFLNVRVVIPMSITAMKSSIAVSFQTYMNGIPSIMILRTMQTYQRAGMKHETPCNMLGILSIGKMIPDKMIVGSISTIPEASMAATCVRVTLEINRPRASDTKINTSDTPNNAMRLPAIGTSSTKTDKSRMVDKFKMERAK